MFGFESDLYGLYRDQEEQQEKEKMIEEAVEAFLGECCDVGGFCEFVDAGHLTLAEMKEGLFKSAEVVDGCVRFWVQNPEEFVETIIWNYTEKK